MYVNLSHAWFLKHGLYGNRAYNDGDAIARRLAHVGDPANHSKLLNGGSLYLKTPTPTPTTTSASALTPLASAIAGQYEDGSPALGEVSDESATCNHA